MAQHFVAPPQWEWYIVWYFFFGGIAGGAYVLGTLLRLFGGSGDEGVARAAFLVAFPALLVCPILLTLDLGRPDRFWHMLVNSRTWGLNFRSWSPMSVGVWALLIFGIFVIVSFVDALVRDGRFSSSGVAALTRRLDGVLGRVFMLVGALLGLFMLGYTGVLLSVSNQPVWSDTWTLGGLFLTSGLSVAAAVVALVAPFRRDGAGAEAKLSRADRWFIVLELALLVVFFVTLGAAANQLLHGTYLVGWALVVLGTLVPLAIHVRGGHGRMAGVVASCLVVLGGLALRMVIVFAPQM